MSVVLTLFIAGAILLAAEAILPGAIAGIIGALLLVIGTVYSFNHYGASGGWLAVGGATSLVGLSLFAEFYLLPRTRWGRRFFLDKSVDTTSHAAPGRAELTGRSGVAESPLRPTGVVVIDGRPYEAFSQDGAIDKGETVRVTGSDTFRIIVTKTSSHA
ncbi:NfeD family protein [Nibricoccus sp. IMCC34717]|uniref:NfeD family protein n=1 Tax=Nibricoccus sp. IMCC34717 TaxID=3034021 RepID=UPI00384C832D